MQYYIHIFAKMTPEVYHNEFYMKYSDGIESEGPIMEPENETVQCIYCIKFSYQVHL